MITKEFTELTDKLIKLWDEKVKSTENGNIIVAKPTMEEKTKGGLYLSDGAKALSEKLTGFGRVIAVARNIIPTKDGELTGDADVKVGDYILFVHEAVYKPPRQALQQLLGIEYTENLLWTTTDKEIIAVFK